MSHKVISRYLVYFFNTPAFIAIFAGDTLIFSCTFMHLFIRVCLCLICLFISVASMDRFNSSWESKILFFSPAFIQSVSFLCVLIIQSLRHPNPLANYFYIVLDGAVNLFFSSFFLNSLAIVWITVVSRMIHMSNAVKNWFIRAFGETGLANNHIFPKRKT